MAGPHKHFRKHGIYLQSVEDSSGTEGIAGVPVGEDMSQSCSPAATGPSTIGQAARFYATTDEPKHCKFGGWSWTSGQIEFQYIPPMYLCILNASSFKMTSCIEGWRHANRESNGEAHQETLLVLVKIQRLEPAGRFSQEFNQKRLLAI